MVFSIIVSALHLNIQSYQKLRISEKSGINEIFVFMVGFLMNLRKSARKVLKADI